MTGRYGAAHAPVLVAALLAGRMAQPDVVRDARLPVADAGTGEDGTPQGRGA